MKFLENWREILLSAWSVRLMALAAILSGASVALDMISPEMIGVDPGIFAGFAAAVNAIALFSRMVQQKKLTGAAKSFVRDESGAVGRRGFGLIAAVSIAASAAFVGPWEGLRTQAYQDIVGVWTVCFGETKGVKRGDQYTPAECSAMLEKELHQYAADLGKCLKAPLPEGAAVALLSLSYNIGTGAACKSTAVRRANAGDLYGACDAILMWNKGRINGKLQVIRGLENRRLAERELCINSLRRAGVPDPARTRP